LRNTPASGAHVGGGDEQQRLGVGEATEIDAVDQDLVQRIGAGSTQVVRREHARRQVGGDKRRRIVERPLPGHDLERAAPERAEQRGVRHAFPEDFERRACALGSAGHQSVRHHHRVHRAGGCAGNALDLEPRFFQQAIEHAPGECAMRTATLQREINQDGLAGLLRLLQSCTSVVNASKGSAATAFIPAVTLRRPSSPQQVKCS
jgi:hypothetical protein